MDTIEKFLRKWFGFDDYDARRIAKIIYKAMKDRITERIRRIEEEL